jgi:hypothetical protein
LFTLGSFLKITKVAFILVDTFSHSQVYAVILRKNGLGYILGDFITNSSGRPALKSNQLKSG